MCDLWKDTLTGETPAGAIPAQIEFALAAMGLVPGGATLPATDATPNRGVRASQIKLYNSGSFFDPRAVPVDDLPDISRRVCGFERVIVECHPALVGDRCLRFRDQLAGTAVELQSTRRKAQAPKLEVAMGLETANPEVLAKLNKRMTLDDFRKAAEFLGQHDIPLRAFVLIKPPFLNEDEAVNWAIRSVEFAFDCGTGVVSLIPTRSGNGALEALTQLGEFSPPRMRTIEAVAAQGVKLNRGRVFVDLWDLERCSVCSECFAARRARLDRMNLEQKVNEPVQCSCERAS
jgi:radical SAM enzyme (TIGR01210 family)